MRFLPCLILLSCLPLLYAEEAAQDWRDYFDRGLSSAQKGAYEEALSEFDKAELESDRPQLITYNRSVCHMELGEYELAKAELEKILDATEPRFALLARYNLGHLHYQNSIKNSSDAGKTNMDMEDAKLALDYFRDVVNMCKRPPYASEPEAPAIQADADQNKRLLLARLKDLEDLKDKDRGERTNTLQGFVAVNQRPVEGARVYFKSKWEDPIAGETRSGKEGKFSIDLDVGKFQLAATLYEAPASALKWNPPLRIPAFAKDTHTLPINGPLSLACPYQASHSTLPPPYTDGLRLEGPDSITSSTDWGELTDGRPGESFPEDSDIDGGYVAFQEPIFQIAMGLPPAREPSPVAASNVTDPGNKPTYTIVLKGFQNGDDCLPPETLRIYGKNPSQKDPQLLYEGKVSPEATGKYEWRSEPIPEEDSRQLSFSFTSKPGKRV
ncbi:MAG: tetratricopeptide repeat protein, partial [Planctomycetes bacterium]|nr:tetratricopeptide repeat protein [Planctomycetota bacterium]